MNSYDTLSREELLLLLKKSEQDKIKYVNKYLEQEEKWNILRLLLAKISHEFKTPLNSIIGFSDLLKYNLKDEKLLDFTNNISTSSKHMLSLIQDLLDLTRAQYKPMELDYKLFNTKEVILEIINSYPNIEMDYTLVDIDIVADIKRFRQLIYNLTSNAVKFNRPSGKIKIITYLDNGFNFEITDSGDGIDESNCSVIFEFFAQANHDIIKRQMGSGIGLALCKSIVEAHNGKISVDSKLGIGSTFKFYLPLEKAR